MSYIDRLALALAAISNIPAANALNPEPAQTLHDMQVAAKTSSSKIIYVDGAQMTDAQRQADSDSIRKIISEYYYDQFRNSQDPDMPYFLFMSKGAGVTLGVGGGVRMRMFYDWNGAVPTNAFSPYTIQVHPDPAARRRFNSTPSGTYLNLRMIGHNTVIGSYGLYVEADFTGYGGRDFHLKKGYAMVRDFTLGYATSTYSDPAAQPAVADAAGPNNKFSGTNVLVRWMPTFRKNWTVALSAETPQTAVDLTGGAVKPASNWLPDAAAFVQYQWAAGQHVRVSGIVRSLSYLTLSDQKRHTVAGWGVQASAVGHPGSRVTLYGTFNYGHGTSTLGGDLQYGGYDLVQEPDDTSRLYAPASLGWCAGVQYNFKPNLFATLAASQTHYLAHDGVDPDQYRHGTFACANVFWSIIPRITVAAEYDWGMRRNYSGQHKAASRVNLSGIFSF